MTSQMRTRFIGSVFMGSSIFLSFNIQMMAEWVIDDFKALVSFLRKWEKLYPIRLNISTLSNDMKHALYSATHFSLVIFRTILTSGPSYHPSKSSP